MLNESTLLTFRFLVPFSLSALLSSSSSSASSSFPEGVSVPFAAASTASAGGSTQITSLNVLNQVLCPSTMQQEQVVGARIVVQPKCVREGDIVNAQRNGLDCYWYR